MSADGGDACGLRKAVSVCGFFSFYTVQPEVDVFLTRCKGLRQKTTRQYETMGRTLMLATTP